VVNIHSKNLEAADELSLQAPKIIYAPGSVDALLHSQEGMKLLQTLCLTGASIGTIEAKLRLPKGKLKRWLKRGANPHSGSYHRLFLQMREWIADVRHQIEERMTLRNPELYLERSTSMALVEDFYDATQTASQEEKTNNGIDAEQLQKQMLESLKVLALQGFDLNKLALEGKLDLHQNVIDAANIQKLGKDDQ
jgi:hypothetical protein